ncbi:DUF1501 domain-containing protein [Kitasatospora sp. NPDC049258]|uniref:DUF1501 domain-containing protein n=1 Tax=Kitasatospora sp. NPDC049258 TaxID=3155394 RepID=UPI0034312578
MAQHRKNPHHPPRGAAPLGGHRSQDEPGRALRHPECPEPAALGPNRAEAVLRAEAAAVRAEDEAERARIERLERLEEAQQERRATTRRRFLAGSALTATALATSTLVSGRLSFGTLADNGTLVQVFLYGGMDGLSLLAPANDPILRKSRPALLLPENGSIPVGRGFALNKAFEPLKKYLDLGELAFVAGVSDPRISRSHFQAADACELGGLPNQSAGRGWLDSLVGLLGPGTPFRAVGIGSTLARSLVGTEGAIVLNSIASLGINGEQKFKEPTVTAVRTLFTGIDHPLEDIVKAGLGALATASDLARTGYTPAAGVQYEGDVGDAFKEIAHLIKGGANVRVASIGMGGYDTHQEQGTNDGHLYGKLNELAKALRAFFDDLGELRKDVTVMVVSEFGRRVAQNTSGTDHGHGGVATILTGRKVAGPILGAWGGLDTLDNGDVPEFNNMFNLFGSVAQSQFGLSAADVQRIFPAQKFEPIGVMR